MIHNRKTPHTFQVATTLTPEEYRNLIERLNQSTCRSLAELLRDLITGQPVTTYFRSRSADEFLPIAMSLSNELTAAGKHLQETIAWLHLSEKGPKPNAAIHELETAFFAFDRKTDEIKEKLNIIYELWWHK